MGQTSMATPRFRTSASWSTAGPQNPTGSSSSHRASSISKGWRTMLKPWPKPQRHQRHKYKLCFIKWHAQQISTNPNESSCSTETYWNIPCGAFIGKLPAMNAKEAEGKVLLHAGDVNTRWAGNQEHGSNELIPKLWGWTKGRNLVLEW